jgi:hypothetical protein
METACKTQAFISLIDEVLKSGDKDTEIQLFNKYLDITQGRRPGKDRTALEKLISRR